VTIAGIERRQEQSFAAGESALRARPRDAETTKDEQSERLFRSLREECVWRHGFAGCPEARAAVAGWIRWCDERRPHQALRYPSLH